MQNKVLQAPQAESLLLLDAGWWSLGSEELFVLREWGEKVALVFAWVRLCLFIVDSRSFLAVAHEIRTERTR